MNTNQENLELLINIEKLITDYDKLNDFEKYSLLFKANLLDGFINYEDIVRFINYKYNKNFESVKTISTEIIDVYKEDADGDIITRLILDCATAEDFKPEKRRYSYDEIISLIKNGKIYPIFARPYSKYCLNGEKIIFNEEEINIDKYYDSKYNFLVERLLKAYPILVLIPYEFNLSRYTGEGWFRANEKTITEENINAFSKTFPISKKEVFSNARVIIENIIKTYERYEYSFSNEYLEEKDVLSKVRKIHKDNF